MAKKPTGRNQPLKVSVEGSELVMRIGIDCLACATANGDCFHEFDDEADQYFRSFAITDSKKFAEDVAIAMQHEEEDGSGPLSNFLDEMAQAAIDDGSTGIDHEQRIEFGKKGKGEKF